MIYVSKYCRRQSAGAGTVIVFAVVVKPGQEAQEKKGEQPPSALGFEDSCLAIVSPWQSSMVQQGVNAAIATIMINMKAHHLCTPQRYKSITYA
ncbi:MAG TPA: hypothetical protein VD794_03285 [Flavisolibacter sp.]|nr:hypothetical protein [Flavisolibacter sp.]